MSQDANKHKNLRQSSITTFFSRVQEPTPFSAKRVNNGITVSASAPAGPSNRNGASVRGYKPVVETVPWDELEARHAASLGISVPEASRQANVKPSATAADVLEILDNDASTSNGVPPVRRHASNKASFRRHLPAEELTDPCSELDGGRMDDSGSHEESNASSSNDFWEQNPRTPCPISSGAPVDQFFRYLSPSDYHLPELRPSNSHTILVSVPLIRGSALAPYPADYVDVWDYNNVRMPSSARLRRPKNALYPEQGMITRWELIRNFVIRNYGTISDFVSAIGHYRTGVFTNAMFSGLTETVQEFSPAQSQFFFSTLLPFIAGLVIDLNSSCTGAIPLLKIGMNHTVTLSQQQIARLLANAFFCTFPVQSASDADSGTITFPTINFDTLYSSTKRKEKRPQCKSEKLKCLLAYFDQIRINQPDGLVSFTRRCLASFPSWDNSQAPLCKVHITHKGAIEEAAGCLQVDFANRFIGGGVLREGCVQEEIRFVINPELIVGQLFTQRLDENECLIITGAQQYSEYSGYGDNFRWNGTFSDVTLRDDWGRRMTQIVVIDAFRFGKPDMQYEPEMLLRELNKAYTGFSRDPLDSSGRPLSAVATGNWGCGAFRGEPRLKFLLQLMACSEAGRDMIYFTFGDTRLQEELFAMYEHLAGINATVGDVYKFLVHYHQDIVSRKKLKETSLYKFMGERFRNI